MGICNCGECVVCMVIEQNGLDRDEMEKRIIRKQELEMRHGKKNE